MFPSFHETTRRRLCRAAFFALCIGPTLAAATWIGYWHRPWRVRDEAQRLGGLLQVRATLADWREPRPGTFRGAAITLADPATGSPLVELERFEFRQAGQTRLIIADQAVADLSNPARFAHKVDEWIAACMDGVYQVHFNELRLKLEDPADDVGENIPSRSAKKVVDFLLRELECRLEPGVNGALRGRLAARSAIREGEGVVLRLSLERGKGGGTPTKPLNIDAEAVGLPVQLLAAVPGFASVGIDATFSGSIQLEFQGQQCSGCAKGRLDKVDLAALLPSASPHRLTGLATVELADFSWRAGQVERLIGSFRSEGGEVSRSLLLAATKHIYCTLGPTTAANDGDPAPMLPFDLAACRFAFDDKGLTLSGDCPAVGELPAGCLIAGGGEPLLMQPAYVDLPAGAWVQLIAGPGSSWLPATREAVDVAGRLPLPSGAEQHRK